MKKNQTRSLVITAQSLGLIFLLILIFSCLSFNVGDWPSLYTSPNNNPPKNWCGSAGEFCAYHLLYFIGPGVFVLLLYGLWLLGFKIAGKKIAQPALRTIGAALLAMAISSTFFCLWPAKMFEFPIGSGGLVGVGAATFLKAHFASFGTFLLLLALWIVAGLLLADDLVVLTLQYVGTGFVKGLGLIAPAWETAIEHSENVKDIWRRLSADKRNSRRRNN